MPQSSLQKHEELTPTALTVPGHAEVNHPVLPLPESYLSAMEWAMFFKRSLFDWGVLIWGTTGLSSLFISSKTLSGFCWH